MKSIKEMSLGELAAFVCHHLKINDIDCVLVGGACVSIYSNNKYQSFDLDFVESRYNKREAIKDILSKIGFFEENRYFKNNETDFFIEFPKGPLAIGNEPVTDIIKKTFPTGELKLISPTESIKDRLSAYYHWNDHQCLEQALMIAENNKTNINEIKRWSISEGKEKEFEEFKKRISK